MSWAALLHSSAFRGAITGLIGAAGADYHAFLTWKHIQDAVTYDWGTAVLRWVQGTVSGAVIGAGFGSFGG
jgi:hypothetical protein